MPNNEELKSENIDPLLINRNKSAIAALNKQYDAFKRELDIKYSLDSTKRQEIKLDGVVQTSDPILDKLNSDKKNQIISITENTRVGSIGAPVIKWKKSKKKITKVQLAVGVCTFVIAGGLLAATATNLVINSNQNKIINPITRDFQKNNINNSTIRSWVDGQMSDTYSYDYVSICRDAYNITSDDKIALYLIYSNLGSTDTEKGLHQFNLVFQTNYQSIEDFLMTNEFKDTKEWKKYVSNTLEENQEEERHP